MRLEEKYAPKNLNEVIYPDPHTEQLIKSLANGSYQDNLMLQGAYGVGKSVIANLLAEAIGEQSYQIETLHFNQLLAMKEEKLYEHVQLTTQWNQLSKAKYFLIFDEFDSAKCKKFNHLIHVLDKYKSKVMMIITTNYPDQIDDAIKSRCTKANFPKLQATTVLPRAQMILQSEGLVMSDQAVLAALNSAQSEGSIRAYMRVLQVLLITH